jgi:seryl-tRNA(Sec) selenium transferase
VTVPTIIHKGQMMNERIRELAEQAGIYKLNLSDETEYWIMEKFAELIVQECANMAESFHRHQYDFTGNLELHEFIKTHFGVEE